MELTIENAKSILDNGIEQARELLKDSSRLDELLLQLETSLREIPEVGDAFESLPDHFLDEPITEEKYNEQSGN